MTATIGKLFTHADPKIEQEIRRLYEFVQQLTTGQPEGIIDGKAIARKSVLPSRLVEETVNTDWYMEVAKGNIPGHSAIIIRGHNPSQTSGSGFVDIAEMGDLSYLASPETMNIASTSGSDADGGVGLQALSVQGVDGAGAEIAEVGSPPFTTTLEFLRVNFLVGLDAGSTGWNVGNVTATASTSLTVQAEMDATESLSQSSHYTVPLDKRFFLHRVELNGAKTSGGTLPVIEFKGYARIGGAGAAWLQLFDKKMDTGVDDELDVDLPIPTQIPTRTDIRMRSNTDQNNTECRTRMYGIVVDEEFL